MKKQGSQYMIFIFIIIVFGLYFFLENESTIFQAEVTSEGVVRIDSMDLPKSVDLAQSLFEKTNNYYDIPYELEAAVPLTNDEGVVSFTTMIRNPLDEKVLIKELIIYQNDIADSRQLINLELQPGMSTTFRTKALELHIKQDEANNVKLEFMLESATGQSFTQTFEYHYYALKACKSNTVCGQGKVCDLDNVARFSKGKEFYCVNICGTNTDCAEGQICISGRCGY